MSGLLKPSEYPAQDAPPAAAAAAREEALRQGAGAHGIDCLYGEDIYQRIALFPCARPNGTVLAYMHGGGWTTGFKEVMAFMAPFLYERGITFASIGYRLAPKHLFPDQFGDVASAIQWLHRNVAAHGGDPNRVFVGGHSAGGHYAALLSVRQDWQAARGLPVDIIKGCLPVSGVYDLTASGGLSARPRFLGAPDSGNDEAASPVRHLKGMAPPFLIAHGENDFPHLIQQAISFEASLRKAGVDVLRIVLAGCDHFRANLATADPRHPWRQRAVEWMMSH